MLEYFAIFNKGGIILWSEEVSQRCAPRPLPRVRGYLLLIGYPFSFYMSASGETSRCWMHQRSF